MFARPELLLLLVAIPAFWFRRLKHRRGRAPFSDLASMSQVSRFRRWIAELPAGLRTVAITAWILAAAGPQREEPRTQVRSEGIDLILAIDVSGSMLAQDFAPSSRLDVAKEQAVAFVRERPNDRIGLVVFAAQAISRVPLTLDHEVLERAILGLRVGELEDGTAIGNGLATAVNRLRVARAPSKVIVLLTDGENNRGTVDPRTAAELASQFGIKVYTIGVGTDTEVPVPVSRDPVRYEPRVVGLDEPLLQQIAAVTGAQYFRATDREALRQVLQQIDRLEKAPVETTRYTRVAEVYRPFLLAGLVALMLELGLSASFVVRVP